MLHRIQLCGFIVNILTHRQIDRGIDIEHRQLRLNGEPSIEQLYPGSRHHANSPSYKRLIKYNPMPSFFPRFEGPKRIGSFSPIIRFRLAKLPGSPNSVLTLAARSNKTYLF